jgi:hypothetical protein
MVQWIGIVVGLCCRPTQSSQQPTVVLAGDAAGCASCLYKDDRESLENM